jgi:hypothetical protein
VHTRIVSKVLSIVFLLTGVMAVSCAKADDDRFSKLISALITIESGGDDNAVGDKHLADKAYGCLQIRQPCVDDVNRKHGTNYRAEDCLGNRALSIWIFREYMSLYATKKSLGRKPTDEDRARIWNGGPKGHKKQTTKSYWNKVKKKLKS